MSGNKLTYAQLPLLGLLLLAGSLSVMPACTSTSTPEENGQFLPEEFTKEENANTYGVIDEDKNEYQWSSHQYEDPRFGEQLENSPLARPGEDYQPITSADAADEAILSTDDGEARKVTKASHRSKGAKGSKSAGKSSRSKRGKKAKG